MCQICTGLWPYIPKKLVVACDRLVRVPANLGSIRINFIQCPLLEVIEEQKNAVLLRCTWCPRLRRIGDAPNLQALRCDSCESLQELGQTPKLQSGQFVKCPALPSIPTGRPYHFIGYTSECPLTYVPRVIRTGMPHHRKWNYLVAWRLRACLRRSRVKIGRKSELLKAFCDHWPKELIRLAASYL